MSLETTRVFVTNAVTTPTEDLDDEAGEAGKPEEVTDGGQVERDGKGHRDVAKKLGKALEYLEVKEEVEVVVHLVGNDDMIIDNRRDKHLNNMSNKYSNTSMKIMDKMVRQESSSESWRCMVKIYNKSIRVNNGYLPNLFMPKI